METSSSISPGQEALETASSIPGLSQTELAGSREEVCQAGAGSEGMVGQYPKKVAVNAILNT